MRLLLTASLLFWAAAARADDEPKPAAIKKADPVAKSDDDSEKKPKLGMGDLAPSLKITKWMKGDAVNAYESNKVYVVEFWATWCGPCITAMPHLCELQDEYRAKGLVVLGVTCKDPNNSAEQVTKFVEGKKGQKLNYAVAFCEDRDTHEAYMKAAGQNGIPCSFVIDKAGKVAYIGHPMSLDDVLPKVLDGTWKGKEDMEAIEKVNKELNDIYRKVGRDAEEALKDLAAFEVKHPAKAKGMAPTKIVILLQAKKFDDAKAVSEQVLEKAMAKKDGSAAAMLCQRWVAKQLNPDKKCMDLAVKAGEAALLFNGDDDLGTLLALAEAYHLSGAKDKAVTTGDKAMEQAKGKPYEKQIADRVKPYRGEEKDAPKDKP